MRGTEVVLFLVVLATVVASLAQRLRVPAPSLLVVAGLLVGEIPGVPTVRLTPDLVSLVVLPPLLYAAAEELSWRDLRQVWRPVTLLASGLVLASALTVAAITALLMGLPWPQALLLGAVLSSTDPVAVSALGRRLSLPPRLQALVQGESLFNDATSLVLFAVALPFATDSPHATWGDAVLRFVVLAGGGALVGVVAGQLAALIRRRTENVTLESAIALLTPYVTYVVAQRLNASGVTAVVVAGVLLGTRGRTTAHVRLHLHAVFSTVVFVLESVVFALIGLELPTMVGALSGSHSSWPAQALLLATALMIIRVLWVFPLAAVPGIRRDAPRPSWRAAAVVSWAGTRGVVPLAAALSIPLTDARSGAEPYRDLILVLTTSVVAITLVAQGFSLAPLVRRAGVTVTPLDARNEEIRARLRLAEVSHDHLEQLVDLETTPEVVLSHVRHEIDARLHRVRDQLDDAEGETTGTPTLRAAHRRLRLDLIAMEGEELSRLYDRGVINEATRRRLQRELDLAEAALGDEPRPHPPGD